MVEMTSLLSPRSIVAIGAMVRPSALQAKSFMAPLTISPNQAMGSRFLSAGPTAESAQKLYPRQSVAGGTDICAHFPELCRNEIPVPAAPIPFPPAESQSGSPGLGAYLDEAPPRLRLVRDDLGASLSYLDSFTLGCPGMIYQGQPQGFGRNTFQYGYFVTFALNVVNLGLGPVEYRYEVDDNDVPQSETVYQRVYASGVDFLARPRSEWPVSRDIEVPRSHVLPPRHEYSRKTLTFFLIKLYSFEEWSTQQPHLRRPLQVRSKGTYCFEDNFVLGPNQQVMRTYGGCSTRERVGDKLYHYTGITPTFKDSYGNSLANVMLSCSAGDPSPPPQVLSFPPIPFNARNKGVHVRDYVLEVETNWQHDGARTFLEHDYDNRTVAVQFTLELFPNALFGQGETGRVTWNRQWKV